MKSVVTALVLCVFVSVGGCAVDRQSQQQLVVSKPVASTSPNAIWLEEGVGAKGQGWEILAQGNTTRRLVVDAGHKLNRLYQSNEKQWEEIGQMKVLLVCDESLGSEDSRGKRVFVGKEILVNKVSDTTETLCVLIRLSKDLWPPR